MTNTGKIPAKSQTKTKQIADKDWVYTSITQGLSSGCAAATVTDTQDYQRLIFYEGFTVIGSVVFTSSRVYAKRLLRNWIQLPIHCKQMRMFYVSNASTSQW